MNQRNLKPIYIEPPFQSFREIILHKNSHRVYQTLRDDKIILVNTISIHIFHKEFPFILSIPINMLNTILMTALYTLTQSQSTINESDNAGIRVNQGRYDKG